MLACAVEAEVVGAQPRAYPALLIGDGERLPADSDGNGAVRYATRSTPANLVAAVRSDGHGSYGSSELRDCIRELCGGSVGCLCTHGVQLHSVRILCPAAVAANDGGNGGPRYLLVAVMAQRGRDELGKARELLLSQFLGEARLEALK